MFAKLRTLISARPLAVALCAAMLLGSLFTGAFAVNQTVDRLFASTLTAPALTSCGTSPAITGTDFVGTVTMGTGTPTGCVITFNVAYTVAPICVVSWIATPLASQSYATSTTAITLTQTATNSNVVKYICVGNSI